MTVAAFDTNLLASGIIRANPNAAPARLLDSWRAGAGLFSLAISEHILSELARTFTKPYFAARITAPEADEAILRLRSAALLTELTIAVRGVATQPADDLVLATAVSAEADFLVTADIALQQLGVYQGVRIVSPRAFLDLLTQPA